MLLVVTIAVYFVMLADSYTATVPETSNASSVIRMFVTQVTATDLDQRDTPNSEIEYNITDVFVTNRVEGSTDVS